VQQAQGLFGKRLPLDTIVDSVQRSFPQAEVEKIGRARVRVKVESESFLALCRYIQGELGFDHVSSVTGVDLMDRIQAVYHISSYGSGCIMEILVDLPRDHPTIESITPLWEGANYHEREAFDLLGIVYLNHPDLRRILLPDDAEFHPLRKDFELGRG